MKVIDGGNMVKKIYMVIILGFLFIAKVDAACSYEESSRLQKFLNNIQVSYDYEEKNNISFKVTFTNIPKDLYLVNSFTGQIIAHTGETLGEYVEQNLSSGQDIRYIAYGNRGECKDELIGIKYVSLPYYNKYYDDPLCEGIEEYSLCQKWTTHSLTSYEKFSSEIKTYKESLKKEPIIRPEEEKTLGMFDYFTTFLLKYYYGFLITIIIICSIAIYYLNKKNKFTF